MSAKHWVAIFIALMFAATYALVHRYALYTIPNSAGFIILDRWTGEGCWVNAGLYDCYDRSMKQRAAPPK